MIDPPPIEARCLDKSFGDSPVLRGVNLKLDRGAGAIIVGRNGSGKSTLLRVLAGLAAASAGQALLFGRPAQHAAPQDRRRLGVVMHQSFLYPGLTARENLQFSAALYGLAHRASEANRWLKLTGLSHMAEERVRTFSRGMEQRLSIARAMITSPEVLLMDEPLAALDADGVALVVGLTEEAIRRGCTVVLTAHEALRLERISVPVYELARGRLHLLGLPHDSGGERAAAAS